MTSLRPRIRKENMRDSHAFRRQQVAHGVAEFQTQDAKIILSGPHRALLDFAHATKQPLHREQVDFGMLPRISERKSAVTRAEIELDRMVVAEDLAPIQARADVGEDEGGTCESGKNYN
jgi:hypothetical protein